VGQLCTQETCVKYLAVTADDLVALGPGGDMIGATDPSRLNLALVVTAVACIASAKGKRQKAKVKSQKSPRQRNAYRASSAVPPPSETLERTPERTR